MAKPIERTIIQPVMPREIDLKEPMWFAVTEANLDKFVADIKEEHGDIVFLAMSIPMLGAILSPDFSLHTKIISATVFYFLYSF